MYAYNEKRKQQAVTIGIPRQPLELLTKFWARYYNTKVSMWNFKEGDMVLRKWYRLLEVQLQRHFDQYGKVYMKLLE